MKAIPFLLLSLLVWLPGCAVFDRASAEPNFSKTQDLTIPFGEIGSAVDQHTRTDFDYDVAQLIIDRTPVGSFVQAAVAGLQIQGTLLRKSRKDFVLVNCISTDVVADIDGRKCARKSHVPLQFVETSQKIQFSILAPPSEKFAPEKMRFQTDDLTVEAVEFQSGRIQHWNEPTLDAQYNRQHIAPAEMEQKLTSIPLGSHIAILSDSGRKYNAFLSRSGPQGLTLFSCLAQEMAVGPDGSSQIKTSYTPWQTIPLVQISTCSIVSSSPPDGAPPMDDDCRNYSLTDFVYKSGRRQSDWKSARDDREIGRLLDGRTKWFNRPWMLSSNTDLN